MLFLYFIYYLGLILISPSLPSLNKKDLLLTYIRLKVKYFIFVSVFKKDILTEKIFGFRLKLVDYLAFVSMFEEIFIRNVYYFEAEKDNPSICDCGANVGIALLYFKKLYPNCKVIAFEPDEKAYRLLKVNVEANQFKNVRLVKAAVYKKEGFVNFYYGKAGAYSLSMSVQKYRGKSISYKMVESVILSSYMRGSLDFLKMDIEGAEGAVIDELFRSGRLKIVRECVFEYHHHIKSSEDSLSKTLKIFEESNFGYQINSRAIMPFSRGKFQDILIYAYKK